MASASRTRGCSIEDREERQADAGNAISRFSRSSVTPSVAAFLSLSSSDDVFHYDGRTMILLVSSVHVMCERRCHVWMMCTRPAGKNGQASRKDNRDHNLMYTHQRHSDLGGGAGRCNGSSRRRRRRQVHSTPFFMNPHDAGLWCLEGE